MPDGSSAAVGALAVVRLPDRHRRQRRDARPQRPPDVDRDVLAGGVLQPGHVVQVVVVEAQVELAPGVVDDAEVDQPPGRRDRPARARRSRPCSCGRAPARTCAPAGTRGSRCAASNRYSLVSSTSTRASLTRGRRRRQRARRRGRPAATPVDRRPRACRGGRTGSPGRDRRRGAIERVALGLGLDRPRRSSRCRGRGRGVTIDPSSFCFIGERSMPRIRDMSTFTTSGSRCAKLVSPA